MRTDRLPWLLALSPIRLGQAVFHVGQSSGRNENATVVEGDQA
jgi:hypothetical protein